MQMGGDCRVDENRLKIEQIRSGGGGETQSCPLVTVCYPLHGKAAVGDRAIRFIRPSSSSSCSHPFPCISIPVYQY
jgi:hypothetical protein